MSTTKTVTGYTSNTPLKQLYPASNITKEEYLRFHKMVAMPALISKCVQSFNGKILVMPKTHTSSIAKHELKSLKYQYYALMGLTFTTFSSVLGMTNVHQADEDINGITTATPLPITIQNYLNVSSEHLIIRKYELYFKIPDIHIEIFHVKDKDVLHMVAIFSDKNRVLQIYVFLFIMSIVVMICTYILYSNNYFDFIKKYLTN